MVISRFFDSILNVKGSRREIGTFERKEPRL